MIKYDLLICLCDLNLWRHRAPGQSGVEYGFQCTQELTGKSGLPTYFCQRVCLPCCQLWVCKRKLLIHLEKRYKKCIELRIWCKLLLLIVICSQFWVSVVFFKFIIFMELGNNYLNHFLKLPFMHLELRRRVVT